MAFIRCIPGTTATVDTVICLMCFFYPQEETWEHHGETVPQIHVEKRIYVK